MMIHDITEMVGKSKNRRRVGRGTSSGHGKTCGRGTKGAGSRSGWSGSIRASREGGQTPWFRRIPKRGFSNVNFRKVFAVVNVSDLEKHFASGAQIDAAKLVSAGLIRDAVTPVKVLGDGQVTKRFVLTVSAITKGATDKIMKAGGSVSVLEA
jgi:large subunit ribosomal protein L15